MFFPAGNYNDTTIPLPWPWRSVLTKYYISNVNLRKNYLVTISTYTIYCWISTWQKDIKCLYTDYKCFLSELNRNRQLTRAAALSRRSFPSSQNSNQPAPEEIKSYSLWGRRTYNSSASHHYIVKIENRKVRKKVKPGMERRLN